MARTPAEAAGQSCCSRGDHTLREGVAMTVDSDNDPAAHLAARRRSRGRGARLERGDRHGTGMGCRVVANHSHALVHRHFEAHHPESLDDGEPEFTHDGEHVVWLDAVTTHQAAYQFHPPSAELPAGFDAIPLGTSWSVTAFDDAAPVHAPPRWSPSLRGPPCLRA